MIEAFVFSKLTRRYGFTLLFLYVFILSRCANQVAPTGGSKDITPPKVIKASPENMSTMFNSSDIVLTFDEYVTLNDANSQIYISPFPGKKPDYKVKNKHLFIRFRDSLQQNTTYTIYFGNAIRDLNEGNIMQNYSYVFSTGRNIDSLSVKGIVNRVTDNSPVDGAIVALYFSTNDSVIYKQRPDYYTRSNKEGQFVIRNIKAHQYRIIAFEDVNQDLKYNDDETIAFSDSLCNVRDTTTVIPLRLFKPQRITNKLYSAKSSGYGKMTLAFANPVIDLGIKFLNTKETPWLITNNVALDSCTVYFNPTIKDSLRFIATTNDSKDTLTVLFKSAGVKNISKDTLSPFNSNPLATNLTQEKQKTILYFGQILRISAVGVIDSIYIPQLTLLNAGSKSIPASLSLKYNAVTHEQYLEVSADLSSDNQYKLLIPQYAWKYKNGQWNDSTHISFYYTDIEATGNLALIVFGTGMNQNYILELSNSKGEITYSATFDEDKRFTVKNLPPGKYKIRAIADANWNGYFDTGDYHAKRQPEAIIVFPNEITVRANWDMDVELSLKNIRKH